MSVLTLASVIRLILPTRQITTVLYTTCADLAPCSYGFNELVLLVQDEKRISEFHKDERPVFKKWDELTEQERGKIVAWRDSMWRATVRLRARLITCLLFVSFTFTLYSRSLISPRS